MSNSENVTKLLNWGLQQSRIFRSTADDGTEMYQIRVSNQGLADDFAGRLNGLNPTIAAIGIDYCIEFPRKDAEKLLDPEHFMLEEGMYEGLTEAEALPSKGRATAQPQKPAANNLPKYPGAADRDTEYTYLFHVVEKLFSDGKIENANSFNEGVIALAFTPEQKADSAAVARALRHFHCNAQNITDAANRPIVLVSAQELQRASLLPKNVTVESIQKYGDANLNDLMQGAFADKRVAKNKAGTTAGTVDVLQIIAPRDMEDEATAKEYLLCLSAKINGAAGEKVATPRNSKTHQQPIVQMSMTKAQNMGLLPEGKTKADMLETLPREFLSAAERQALAEHGGTIKAIIEEASLAEDIAFTKKANAGGKVDTVKIYTPTKNDDFHDLQNALNACGIPSKVRTSDSRKSDAEPGKDGEPHWVTEIAWADLKEKNLIPASVGKAFPEGRAVDDSEIVR